MGSLSKKVAPSQHLWLFSVLHSTKDPCLELENLLDFVVVVHGLVWGFFVCLFWVGLLSFCCLLALGVFLCVCVLSEGMELESLKQQSG